MNGNAILFKTNRYGLRSHASWGSQDDLAMIFLNQEALDKYLLNKEDSELLKEAEKAEEEQAKKDAEKNKDKKDEQAKKDDNKDIVVELDGIEDRIVRVTTNSSDIASAMITNDGETLYYPTALEKGYDLWKMDLRKHSTTLVNKMNSKWANIESSKDGKEFFILGSGTMQKLTVAGGKLTPISYSAKMKMDLTSERE